MGCKWTPINSIGSNVKNSTQQVDKDDLKWKNKILWEFSIYAKKAESYTIDSENAEKK